MLLNLPFLYVFGWFGVCSRYEPAPPASIIETVWWCAFASSDFLRLPVSLFIYVISVKRQSIIDSNLCLPFSSVRFPFFSFSLPLCAFELSCHSDL